MDSPVAIEQFGIFRAPLLAGAVRKGLCRVTITLPVRQRDHLDVPNPCYIFSHLYPRKRRLQPFYPACYPGSNRGSNVGVCYTRSYGNLIQIPTNSEGTSDTDQGPDPADQPGKLRRLSLQI